MENQIVESTLKTIPLTSIRQNPDALRDVDRENFQYQQLVDSIRQRGVIQPIQVTEYTDKETGETLYGLINGLQRFTAASDCGFETIPAAIRSIDGLAAMEEQLVTNLIQVETKPVEYSKHLRNMLTHFPTMTLAQLAAKINCKKEWLEQRLNLTKLTDTVGQLVDEGRITITNGIALAALPSDYQDDFISSAATMDVTQFAALVKEKRDEIRKKNLSGRTQEATFEPRAHLRKMADIKGIPSNISLINEILSEAKASTPVEAAIATINYILHLNPAEVAAQRAKYDEQQAIQRDKKAKSEEERGKRALFLSERKTERIRLRMEAERQGESAEEIDKKLAKFDEETKLKVENI